MTTVLRSDMTHMPFQRVLVECLHDQEVHRHHPRLLRLRPCVVLVLTPDDMHMSAFDVAAQRPRVRQQVRITATKASDLPRAQSDAGKQEHDQPVARPAAREEHRNDLFIAGSVDLGLGFLKPMVGSQAVAHHAALTTGRQGQVVAVTQFVDLLQHRGRRCPVDDRVDQEHPHGCEHFVDPRVPADRLAPGPGHHDLTLAGVAGRPPQPEDEQPHLASRRPPVPLCPHTAAQEQGKTLGVRLRRQLRPPSRKGAHLYP
ncbi:hypothetical protein [Streptomyces sp. NPDC006739]|uniref:hypothetical protein n=1 Tax=Streptomyces sp. NPDC006739 TaxID=3364763 RepID=UPI003681C785